MRLFMREDYGSVQEIDRNCPGHAERAKSVKVTEPRTDNIKVKEIHNQNNKICDFLYQFRHSHMLADL